MGEINYGVRVPKNVQQALELDETNGNNLWCGATIKEVGALMGHKTFKYLKGNAKTLKQKVFGWAPLWMIFYIKQDTR